MSKNNRKNGVLIAFEGIDGAGKTTQARLLADFLVSQGFNVLRLKEPTNGQYGQQVRFLAMNGRHNVSPEAELELFLKDRLEDVEVNIRPALDNGHIVIMDRYYFSNMCYQGALGLDPKVIQEENEKFAPVPDLVILLEISPRVGISRITQFRGEKANHFEKEKYLNEVKKYFDKLDEPYLQRIAAVGHVDEIEADVQNAVMSILRRDSKNGKREVVRRGGPRISEVVG